MIRILIAIAALFAFAAYTGHARAEEKSCSAIETIIQSPTGEVYEFRTLKGDNVARAVTFYNSLPGDDLTFEPDKIVFVFLPKGFVNIAFIHNDLVCGGMLVSQAQLPAVVAFILGTKA